MSATGIVALVLLGLTGTAHAFLGASPRLDALPRSGNGSGEPLYVTPYLRRNQTALARHLSLVTLAPTLGLVSHAGFFTVNETRSANHFFWYFPSISTAPDAPLILWLQGGPGASSLFGLFVELGPLAVTRDGFVARKYHWALDHHVLFVDSPVGTGFSSADATGYCEDEACVGADLLESLLQFYRLFPELRRRDFYVAGESYAGKYAPALAAAILDHDRILDPIKLRGLALGNAYVDPLNQLDFGARLYQLGLVDLARRVEFEARQTAIAALIREERWWEALLAADRLMNGALSGGKSYFSEVTGYAYLYSYLHTTDPLDVKQMLALLERDDVRRALHVGALPFHESTAVAWALRRDVMRSAAPRLVSILGSCRVLLYSGQLDLAVPYTGTENFLQRLDFPGAKDYEKASRAVWRVDGEVAGYVKRAGNLTEVLVRNAGHMVPADQPKWALDLITRFTRGKSLA